jgi:hypothetical protein
MFEKLARARPTDQQPSTRAGSGVCAAMPCRRARQSNAAGHRAAGIGDPRARDLNIRNTGRGGGEIDRAGRPPGNRRYSVQARRVRCGGRRAPCRRQARRWWCLTDFFSCALAGFVAEMMWFLIWPDGWGAESLPAIVANLPVPSTEI